MKKGEARVGAIRGRRIRGRVSVAFFGGGCESCLALLLVKGARRLFDPKHDQRDAGNEAEGGQHEQERRVRGHDSLKDCARKRALNGLFDSS